MKLNRLIHTISRVLLLGIALNGASIHAMNHPLVTTTHEQAARNDDLNHQRVIRFADEEGNDNNPHRSNIVTPYINAAASVAVARYVPEIAESLMPRITPNYPLANTLVPATIKYGGYALGAHFLLKKGLGVNYSDCMKREYLERVGKKAVKLAPNLIPATLCHPQAAQFAADCCTSLASSYVSESSLPTLNKYTALTLMATGALSTLYLVNQNVFNGKLWKKVKRVCKDIRPYLFAAPLVGAYNADAIKNYAMSYVPLKPGSHLHSDLGNGLKATIYW